VGRGFRREVVAEGNAATGSPCDTVTAVPSGQSQVVSPVVAVGTRESELRLLYARARMEVTCEVGAVVRGDQRAARPFRRQTAPVRQFLDAQLWTVAWVHGRPESTRIDEPAGRAYGEVGVEAQLDPRGRIHLTDGVYTVLSDRAETVHFGERPPASR
jgi:hypothetical protein